MQGIEARLLGVMMLLALPVAIARRVAGLAVEIAEFGYCGAVLLVFGERGKQKVLRKLYGKSIQAKVKLHRYQQSVERIFGIY